MSAGTTQVSSWTPVCQVGMPVSVVPAGTMSCSSVPM